MGLEMLHLQIVRALQQTQRRLKFLKYPLHHMRYLKVLVALKTLHLQIVRALQQTQRRLKFLKGPLHLMRYLKDTLLEMTIAREALETLAAMLLLLGSLCKCQRRRMHEDLKTSAT